MSTTEIDGVSLALAHPDELDVAWVGQPFAVEQLTAAWMVLGEDDLPLNPRILGRPGVGKTTLAYATARALGREVYVVQATMDTRPEDLLVTPVLAEQGKIRYVASGLVTAMIRGGVCVLDEGNRMTEKSWASLAPLLDNRRYVESVVAGIKIRAHPDFRFCTTMNEDASTFDVPEYIQSRLMPRIHLDFPDREEELAILRANLPGSDEEMLGYVASFLERAHRAEERYTVRDGINIARYAWKILAAQEAGRMEPLQDAVLAPPRASGGLRPVERRGPEVTLESWLEKALAATLQPEPAAASDEKKGAAKKKASPKPAAPELPTDPRLRALRHATRQVLGDEALGYLDAPTPGDA